MLTPVCFEDIKAGDVIKILKDKKKILIDLECSTTKDVLNSYINFIRIIHKILLHRNSQNIGKRVATIFTTNYYKIT